MFLGLQLFVLRGFLELSLGTLHETDGRVSSTFAYPQVKIYPADKAYGNSALSGAFLVHLKKGLPTRMSSTSTCKSAGSYSRTNGPVGSCSCGIAACHVI